MPLPLLFMGIAAITAGGGAKSLYDAHGKNNKAQNVRDKAQKKLEKAQAKLNDDRSECGKSIEDVGYEKLFILDNSIDTFINNYEKISNVDMSIVKDIDESKKLKFDKAEFKELKQISGLAKEINKGAAAGAVGGAAIAFGAYNAAGLLATASTGTAIATLSGAAATNATLAFFGGGALAAGGLGMAGGAAVLGGLMAGPALLAMGFIVDNKAGKNLEEAKKMSLEADKLIEEYKSAGKQCDSIRRTAYMYYCMLAQLDIQLIPLLEEMKNTIKNEGTDFRNYSKAGKRSIIKAASTIQSIKAILDTPILNEEGALTIAAKDLTTNYLLEMD